MQQPDPTIQGHPALVMGNFQDQPVTITVCCSCGAMRSVLWLDGDRWYCNQCRAEGTSRPAMFPLK